LKRKSVLTSKKEKIVSLFVIFMPHSMIPSSILLMSPEEKLYAEFQVNNSYLNIKFLIGGMKVK